MYTEGKKSNTVLHGNVAFAQMIMLEKINLIVTWKTAQVFWARFIILTHKVLLFEENLSISVTVLQ